MSWLFLHQAYSPMPPHGFLASSPQAHPYMWGVQVVMILYWHFKDYALVFIWALACHIIEPLKLDAILDL